MAASPRVGIDRAQSRLRPHSLMFWAFDHVTCASPPLTDAVRFAVRSFTARFAVSVLLVHSVPPSELHDTLHNAANGLADGVEDTAALHAGSRSVGNGEIPDNALAGLIGLTALLLHDFRP